MMPAKGGRTDLSDDAVKAAVDYLVAESGGPARQVPAAAGEAPPAEAAAAPAEAPPAEAAAAPAEAAPAEAAAAPAAAAPETAAATADAGKGKEIYDTVCAVCHGAGIAGAPKLGDKAAWEARIAQGPDTLHQHAIQGFMGKAGMMPPKGGRADLSDEDVKAAVDYMVGAAK
jgi:cytochrome c5